MIAVNFPSPESFELIALKRVPARDIYRPTVMERITHLGLSALKFRELGPSSLMSLESAVRVISLPTAAGQK